MTQVDVAIPFHRDVDGFLNEAIASALASRQVKARVILLDGRPAGRAGLAGLMRGRNILVLRNEAGSAAAARNLAATVSDAPYLAFLDSDDLTHPLRLSGQIRAIERTQHPFSVAPVVKFRGRRLVPALLGTFPVDAYDRRLLLLGSYGADASLVVSRELRPAGMTWRDSPLSDWLFAFQHYHFGVVGVSAAPYLYRQHPLQTTRGPGYLPSWLPEEWNNLAHQVGVPTTDGWTVCSIAHPTAIPSLSLLDFMKVYAQLDEIRQRLEGGPLCLPHRNLQDLIARRKVLAWTKLKHADRLRTFKYVMSQAEVQRSWPLIVRDGAQGCRWKR